MLSRRNVRIKVMQLLFALSRDAELKYEEAQAKYWEGIDNTYKLYLFCFYNLTEVARCALKDAEKRKSKHLPSDQDKKFSPKLFENTILRSAYSNEALQKEIKKENCAVKANVEYHEKIYSEFLKEEAYQTYIDKEEELSDTKEILLELFRFCRKSEFFNEMLEDHYPCWLDDKSVVIGAIKKTIKALPTDKALFFKEFTPDEETVKLFGEKLLEITHASDAALLAELKPILENWDHDRLAVVDTILIKMAISEFSSFSTIPTKVTINEYIEVSKNYSTAKSKEFINGVLDKILEKMQAEGRIKKEGRGLVE